MKISEFAKTYGVNFGVLGVTSMAQIEMVLKIVVLLLTIFWTALKIHRHFKDKKENRE